MDGMLMSFDAENPQAETDEDGMPIYMPPDVPTAEEMSSIHSANAQNAAWHADVAAKHAASLAQWVQYLAGEVTQLQGKIEELEGWKRSTLDDMQRLRSAHQVLRRRVMLQEQAEEAGTPSQAIERAKSLPVSVGQPLLLADHVALGPAAGKGGKKGKVPKSSDIASSPPGSLRPPPGLEGPITLPGVPGKPLASKGPLAPPPNTPATNTAAGAAGSPAMMSPVVLPHPHPLEESSPVGTWGCDSCQKWSKDHPGLQRYRCTMGCDFDLCQICYKVQEEKIESSPVALSPEAAASPAMSPMMLAAFGESVGDEGHLEGVHVAPGTVDGVECEFAEWRIGNLTTKLRGCMGRALVSSPFSAAGLQDLRLMVFPDGKEVTSKGPRTRAQKELYAKKVKEGPIEGCLKFKVPDCTCVLEYYLRIGGVRKGPFRHDFSESAVDGCQDFGVDWLKQVGSDQSLTVAVEILSKSGSSSG
jgi:hypothetical protein